MDIINVNDVCLTLGKTEILKHINVSFEEGKIHGLIGRNGSGKTMLMKCICGFIKPTSGEIIVDGKQVGKDVDFPKDMGIIIETPGFIPYYSGYKNLKLLAGLNNKIGKEEIRNSMRQVGLDPDLKRHVRKYKSRYDGSVWDLHKPLWKIRRYSFSTSLSMVLTRTV